MKKILPLLLLFSLNGKAQVNRFEFSLGNVVDKSFNTNQPGFGVLSPVVESKAAFLFSLGYERKIKNNLYVILNLRSVHRRINYSLNGVETSSFFYNVAELPMGLRWKKSLGAQHELLLDLSPGCNRVLTSDKTTATTVNSDKSITADRSDRFEFNSSTQLCYFVQARISLASKLSDTKSVLFFLGYQQQLTSLFRYYAYNSLFGFYGSPVNTNYVSLGLSYQFSGNENRK